MSNVNIGRRALLSRGCRGVGTVAASSLFGSLVREAWGAEPLKRLVIYMSGSGLDESIYGDNTVTSETDFQFKGGFTPLEKIKKDVTFADKFFNLTHVDQHGNGMAALTCARDLRDKNGYLNPRPGGPSFDYLLAQKLAVTEPFSVVPMGLRADDNLVWERTASGVDRVAPCYQSAKAAFDRLFGPLRGGQDIGVLAQRKRLVMKQILADAKTMSVQLAAPERVRLDEYTDSLQTMAMRLDRWAAGQKSGNSSCTAPDPAAATTTFGYKIIDQEVDLVPFIFQCGLSRLTTIVAQPGGGRTWFPGFKGEGVSYPDTMLNQHDMNHIYLDPATRGNQVVADRVRGLYAYHANNVARLWQKLKAIPEGAGTMADNTTILWFSDGGGNHHNGWRDNPVIIVGGWKKLRMGRYMRLPRMAHSMAEVFLTIAKAMGAPIDKVGDGTDPCRGPVPGMLV